MKFTVKRIFINPFLIASFAIMACLSWALASPVGASPDEDYHLASIWCGQGERPGYCEISGAEVLVPSELVKSSGCFAFYANQSANCTYTNELIPSDRVNLVKNYYPPSYYWLMSFFVTDSIHSSVIFMRLFNILLVVIGLMASIRAAHAIDRQSPLDVFIFSAVPTGMFVLSSVNPSGLAYAFVGIFFVFFKAFLESPTGKTKVMIGLGAFIASILAAGTRADATIYILLSLACLWIFFGSRKQLNSLNLSLTFGIILSSVILFMTSTQVTMRFTDSIKFSTANLFFNFDNLPSLWVGSLGTWALGWLDTPLSASVFVFSGSAFVVYLFAVLGQPGFRKRVSLTLTALALIALPIYVLTKGGFLVGQEVQARYLLPLLVILLLVANLRDDGLGYLSDFHRILLFTGLALANSSALHTNLRRYINGLDVGGINLDREIEWWWKLPIGPNVVWILGSLGFAIFLALVFVRNSGARHFANTAV